MSYNIIICINRDIDVDMYMYTAYTCTYFIIIIRAPKAPVFPRRKNGRLGARYGFL